jgi:hypothetical protein
MKRVIIIAAFLWLLLIIVSYRLTAQDSVYVYATGMKGSITEFQYTKYLKAADFDTMWAREALYVDSLYYIKSSGWVSYESCHPFAIFIYTPAPRNLSAARRQRAFRF